MIEVVYKGEGNDDKRNLEVKIPKNVRQIGEMNSNRKIYVEDYVMTHLKNNSENAENIKYGVLLGNIRKSAENTYIFVKGLVEVTEIIENSLIFNDEIWTGIYQDIKDYFDNFEIAGWYVSLPYRIKDDMSPIRKIHLDNFAGNDKVCYMDDRSENEDGFYVFENGKMQKEDGYYIYYEKNPNMQKYINEKINGNLPSAKNAYNKKNSNKIISIKNENEKSLVKRVINMTPGFLKNVQNKGQQNVTAQPDTSKAKTGIKQNENTNAQPDSKTTSVAQSNAKNANAAQSNAKNANGTQPHQDSLREIMKNQKHSTIKPGYAIGTVAVIALLLSTIAMMNNYGELKSIQQSLDKLASDSQTVAVMGQVSENIATDNDTENISNSSNESGNDNADETAGTSSRNSDTNNSGTTGSSDVSLNETNASESESNAVESQGTTQGGSTESQENDTTNLTGTGQGTYDDADSTASFVTSENYCIVKEGQTLYDISMTYYNTSSMVDAIKEANGIDDNYTIYEGEKIILP